MLRILLLCVRVERNKRNIYDKWRHLLHALKMWVFWILCSRYNQSIYKTDWWMTSTSNVNGFFPLCSIFLKLGENRLSVQFSQRRFFELLCDSSFLIKLVNFDIIMKSMKYCAIVSCSNAKGNASAKMFRWDEKNSIKLFLNWFRFLCWLKWESQPIQC